MKKILILITFLIASCNLSPGSYPDATRYEVNLSEIELIKKIELFKKENQEYVIPRELGFVDGRRTDKDHWYHIYFNNPIDEKIIKIWVRKESETKTILAFVAIKPYNGTGNWKFINKDFSVLENKKEIKEFEKIILSKSEISFIEK